MNRKLLLGLMVALLASAALDAQGRKAAAAKHEAPAKAQPELAVDVPPPSGNWEAKAPAAPGYVWSVGYYEWKDGRYAWKPGEWVLAKEGMEYRQHRWVQRPDGKWILTGGDWVKAGEDMAGKQ